MTSSDASQQAAKLAVARILAGIEVTITDDISEFREVLEPLNMAVRSGGAFEARQVYLFIRSTAAWLQTIDDPEDIYPDIYDPELIDQDDLMQLYNYEDSDFGQAEALIYLYKNRLRFVWGMGWMLWNGLRWVVDEWGAAKQYGMMGARIRLKAALYMVEQIQGDDAARDKALMRVRAALSRRNLAPVDRALKAAETMPYFVTEAGDLDLNHFMIGVKNGVIDLQTGQLVPPNPDHLITKRTNIPYYPDAPCPRWEQFLSEIFQGDEDLVEYVRRCIGYCLTGDTREQYLWVAHGIGANGKSVFIEIVRALLGEYGSAIEFKTLMHGGASDKGDDLAPLRGVRFVAASESEQGKRLNEALVKQMTGGDPLRVRHLYGKFFTFVPTFKIWLVTNHKPVIVGTDRGIWRRLRMIPFNARFEGGNADKELPVKLRSELPGILAWAVRGALAWQRDGLNVPFSVAEATEGYRQEMDVLGTFLAERTAVFPEGRATIAQIYDAYKTFIEDSGMQPMSKFALSRALEERGFKQAKSGSERYWKELGLRS